MKKKKGILYYDIPLDNKVLVGCQEFFIEKNICPTSFACYRQFLSLQPDKPSMDRYSVIKI